MYAVIPAAGSGTRLGELTAQSSKALLTLRGNTSILEMTLKAIAQADVVKGFVVVCKAAEEGEMTEILGRISPDTDNQIVIGGEVRQESVFNGLKVLEGKASYVLIHDAARPFVSREDIHKVIDLGIECHAAILATPVVSTIKEVDSEGAIERTIPRAKLYQAQTPQVFSLELILQGHRAAVEDKFTGTDDSELIERMGIEVRIVEGSPRNIKITTPEDLEIARGMRRVV